MANLTNSGEVLLRGHMFRGVSYTAPTSWSVALCTDIPTDATFTEITGTSYARQVINANTTNWSVDSTTSGVVYNNSGIVFPVAGSNWGWTSGAALIDNNSNYMYWGSFTNPKNIESTDQFTIPISGLSIRFE
jgi:hypothetical protein